MHPLFAAAMNRPDENTVIGVATLLGLACAGLAGFLVYFLPVFVATFRRHQDSAAIAVLTFFLGWSFVGWVAALCWSLTAVRAKRKSAAREQDAGGDDDFDFR